MNSVSLKPLINSRLIFTGSRLLDESSSSSDEENDRPKSKNSKEEAARKLNELIQLMTKVNIQSLFHSSFRNFILKIHFYRKQYSQN